DVDLITFAERLDDWHSEADFRPQCGHDDLPPAGLLHPFDDAGVLPGVDERAVDRFLIRENVLQWFEEVATLPLEDGGQERGHAEDFCGFGQANHIVNDRLGIVTAQAGELKWLM